MATREQRREVGSTTEACRLRSQDTLVPILPLSGRYGGGRVTSLSRRSFFPTGRRVSRGRRLRGGVPALYEPCGTGSGQCAVVKVGAAAEATQLYLGAVEDVVFLIFT